MYIACIKLSCSHPGFLQSSFPAVILVASKLHCLVLICKICAHMAPADSCVMPFQHLISIPHMQDTILSLGTKPCKVPRLCLPARRVIDEQRSGFTQCHQLATWCKVRQRHVKSRSSISRPDPSYCHDPQRWCFSCSATPSSLRHQ